jgi:5,10-methylene-tetrahydrofolate dehydrogenase/methenyl tetrahydrofolate cyclohydrolase
VGKPLALLLLNRNATTTVTHVYTSNRGNLEIAHADADYLVVAAGVPQLIGWTQIKEGAVHPRRRHQPRGRVPGVRHAQSRQEETRAGSAVPIWLKLRTRPSATWTTKPVAEKAAAITTRTGGVGAVTNMMLARNTLRAARQQLDEK